MDIDELLQIAIKESPWHKDEFGDWAAKDGALREIIVAEKEGYYEPPKALFFLKEEFFKAIHTSREKFGIVIIRGPRRVGKTSTLKYLIKEMISRGYDKESFFYVSLDDERLLEMLEKKKMLKEFLTALIQKYSPLKPIILILDEVTFYKGWARALKNLVDNGVIGPGVGIIATGSYSLDLSSAKSELKGRLGPLGEDLRGDVFFSTRRFIEVVESLLGKSFKSFIKNTLGNVGRRLGLLEFLAGFQDKFEAAKYSYRSKIDELVKNHYDDLHRIFEIYKYAGGYPRAFVEALASSKKGRASVSDARYKDDIYDLLVTDCRKFKLDENELQKILLQIKSPAIKIAPNFDTLKAGNMKKEELSKYIDYLEASGLFMFVPNVSSPTEIDPSSLTIIPSGKIRKLVVTDPAVFLALYYCSRNVVDIYKKANTQLPQGIQEAIFEAITISHLRFLPLAPPFKNIAYVLEANDAGKELADALIWYPNYKGKFISMPIEVKSGTNLNQKELLSKAKVLKDEYKLGRLVVVANTKNFEIYEHFVIMPIELFLLLF